MSGVEFWPRGGVESGMAEVWDGASPETHQVVPMLHILRKNSKLCTVFDLWEQKDNMVKDAMPFPDQDIIHNDMARAAYWSKLDMSKAYEQICIILEHIPKTVFATVLGTFRSQVMQMGDCNAPSTFQWLMTAIFCDCISWFVHLYLDEVGSIETWPTPASYNDNNVHMRDASDDATAKLCREWVCQTSWVPSRRGGSMYTKNTYTWPLRRCG